MTKAELDGAIEVLHADLEACEPGMSGPQPKGWPEPTAKQRQAKADREAQDAR